MVEGIPTAFYLPRINDSGHTRTLFRVLLPDAATGSSAATWHPLCSAHVRCEQPQCLAVRDMCPAVWFPRHSNYRCEARRRAETLRGAITPRGVLVLLVGHGHSGKPGGLTTVAARADLCSSRVREKEGRDSSNLTTVPPPARA